MLAHVVDMGWLVLSAKINIYFKKIKDFDKKFPVLIHTILQINLSTIPFVLGV
jgi:hypothetical protein